MADSNVQILGPVPAHYAEVVTDDALEFVAELHRNFETTRRRLMDARKRRQAEIDAGASPDFLTETRGVREGDWRVQPAPADLTNRRVEITGPSSRRARRSGDAGFRVVMLHISPFRRSFAAPLAVRHAPPAQRSPGQCRSVTVRVLSTPQAAAGLAGRDEASMAPTSASVPPAGTDRGAGRRD